MEMIKVIDDATSLLQKEMMENLARLDSEEMEDLNEVMEFFRNEEDLDERESIAQTIFEIICPDVLKEKVCADLTESEAAIAREKLTAYRQKIGEQIQSFRKKRKLTQNELAEKAGIPQSHVSRLERGVHVPTEATMKKVAKALRVAVSKLDPGFD